MSDAIAREIWHMGGGARMIGARVFGARDYKWYPYTNIGRVTMKAAHGWLVYGIINGTPTPGDPATVLFKNTFNAAGVGVRFIIPLMPKIYTYLIDTDCAGSGGNCAVQNAQRVAANGIVLKQ